MSQPGPSAPRRARHLMDPANPRPAYRGSGMSLTHVQQWIASTLAVSTVMHLAIGFVLAAYFAKHGGPTPQVGLLVVAGLLGSLGIAAGFAIHRRSMLTPWLIAGWLPSLVGAWLIFWR